MFNSIGFAIIGLVFLILTSIMYLIKKKYDSIKNNLFRLLMFLAIFMSIMEIVFPYFIKLFYDNYVSIVVCKIVCIIYLFSIIAWSVSFFYYTRNLGVDDAKNIADAAKKKSIYRKILLITIALCLISSFFGINCSYVDNIYIIAGPMITFIYVIVSIIVSFMLITLIRSNYKRSIKFPIYFIILVVVITTIFKFCFIDLNDISFIIAFSMISLYFTVESQDIILLNELEEAKKNAEISDKAKTDFLSSMSHEIRTPLNTILGFSQTLLNDKEWDENLIRDDIKSINEASNNLLKLINDILDVSRIESGKEILYEKKYELGSVLSDLDREIKKKHTNFEIMIDSNMPSVYYGDSLKIIKLLNSLVLSYSDNKKPIILGVSYDDKISSLKFHIYSKEHLYKDDINFDVEELNLLDIGTKNNIDSNVLNIIVAKKLAVLLNCEIQINGNNEYYVVVSQKVIDAKKIGNLKINNEINEEINNYTGKTALVVDDNLINLKLAKKVLERFNIDVTIVDNGKKCIEMVKNNVYDIIFLDHMMPDMDGIKTLNNLRSLGLKLPPIIVLTANVGDEFCKQYRRIGFDDYLSKPIDIELLNRILKKYIK